MLVPVQTIPEPRRPVILLRCHLFTNLYNIFDPLRSARFAPDLLRPANFDNTFLNLVGPFQFSGATLKIGQLLALSQCHYIKTGHKRVFNRAFTVRHKSTLSKPSSPGVNTATPNLWILATAIYCNLFGNRPLMVTCLDPPSWVQKARVSARPAA